MMSVPPIPVAHEPISQLLRQGEVCGVPTETVYGLAGNAYDDRAVAKIFALKSRPAFNPLIIHYGGCTLLYKDVIWPESAEKLATVFWPGPLTLVLKRSPHNQVSLLASAGLPTLAVRMPSHPLFLELLRALPFPLAAPSANPSGRLSPTKASHVANAFPDLPLMDGGDCTFGLESTVLDLSKGRPLLLRPGALDTEKIEAVLGEKLEVYQTDSTSEKEKKFYSPGLLPSHYAPVKPLRMNARTVESYEGLLAFGPTPLSNSFLTLNLSPTGDFLEAASHFFDYLHQLDAYPCGKIAVMPIPEEGLGVAINDRLRRASASRKAS